MTQQIGQLNGKWSTLLKVQLAGLPIVFAVMGWICMQLIGLSMRVAVIEGNRFTSAAAYEMEQRIDARFDRLPPKWFIERMDKLENRLTKLEEKIP